MGLWLRRLLSDRGNIVNHRRGECTMQGYDAVAGVEKHNRAVVATARLCFNLKSNTMKTQCKYSNYVFITERGCESLITTHLFNLL